MVNLIPTATEHPRLIKRPVRCLRPHQHRLLRKRVVDPRALDSDLEIVEQELAACLLAGLFVADVWVGGLGGDAGLFDKLHCVNNVSFTALVAIRTAAIDNLLDREQLPRLSGDE